jgi:hypothetical protein
MTVFTGLRRTCSLTVGDNRLGRLIGQGTPGAREVTAVTVGYSVVASTSAIVVHMLGQLRLFIRHIRMTGGTVVTACGIRARKVVMTRCRLRVTPADTVERWVEAIVVEIIMTRRTV